MALALRQMRLPGFQIAKYSNLSRATVSRVLTRHGLAKLHDLDPPPPAIRYQREQPGDQLHIDIKKLGRIVRPGYRVTGNKRDHVPGASWWSVGLQSGSDAVICCMVFRTALGRGMAFYALLAICAAVSPQSLWAQRPLVSLGSGSLSVDPGAVTAAYKQSGLGISFGPRVSLGDSIGGRISPIGFSGSNAALGLLVRLTGANPELPFTFETFDANFNVTAKFQGQTTGAGNAASFVPLRLVEGSVRGTTIAGLQFTWDGAASISVELLSLALSTSPSVPPQPVPDRTRPTVKIVLPATVRGNTYTLSARLTDNVRPVRVQYRLRPLGAKSFGKWTSVNLSNKAPAQDWSQPGIVLNKRGVWEIQVQVFDAAKNASLVPTFRVNRTQ